MKLISICLIILLLSSGVLFMSCESKSNLVKDYVDVNQVKSQIEKFAPVEINYDESLLNDTQKHYPIIVAKLRLIYSFVRVLTACHSHKFV